MPSIIRPLSTPVDINLGANTVNDSVLVSVYNTNSLPALVTNDTTGNGVYVGPGERIYFEKSVEDEISTANNASSVWASEVAYRT
jgi:hypothetical protein